MATYNPEANGLVERWHRVLKDTLKATSDEHQDWVDQLLILLLGLRARANSDSGVSPHQLVFGTELYLPADFPSQMQKILSVLCFTRSCRKPSRVRSTLTLQAIDETSQQPLRR